MQSSKVYLNDLTAKLHMILYDNEMKIEDVQLNPAVSNKPLHHQILEDKKFFNQIFIGFWWWLIG